MEIATGTLTLQGIDSATALQQKDAIAASIAALFEGDRVSVTILVLERRRLQSTDQAVVIFTVTAPLSAQAISTTLTEAQASGALDANLAAQGVDATAASVACLSDCRTQDAARAASVAAALGSRASAAAPAAGPRLRLHGHLHRVAVQQHVPRD